MKEMLAKLDEFPAVSAPLANAARRLLDRPSDLSTDGVMRIGHRLWVATENYAITLYPGLPADSLARYCDGFGLNVPELYAGFLAATNGTFCFGMSLVGVPMSISAAGNTHSKENVGYFLGDRRLISMRKNGKVVGEWDQFETFLKDDLQASEQLEAERRPEPRG